MSFDGARLGGSSAVKQPRGGEPSVRPFPLSLAVAVAVRAPPLTADASKRRSNYTTSLQLPIAVSLSILRTGTLVRSTLQGRIHCYLN